MAFVGLLINSAEVVNAATDFGQPVPMPEQAEAMTGVRAGITVADGGYHSTADL